jgi:hypothetical protein
MKAYVITAYTGSHGYRWQCTLDCYNSLRKFVPNDLIIMVNNFPEPIHPSLQQDQNLRYIIAENNFWELGGIQAAYKYNQDVDAFFCVLDSVVFTNVPPDFKDDIFFWKNEFRNMAPDMDIVRNWCIKHFPSLTDKYNRRENRVCHGTMGFYTRPLLDKMMKMGLEDIRVTNKSEACASEGLIGFLLREVKPDIPCYNDAGFCPRNGYKNSADKYEFMVKYPRGRISGFPNSVYAEQLVFHCPMGSTSHPQTPFSFRFWGKDYSSLCDALNKNKESDYHSIFMHFYTINRSALLLITEKRYFGFNVEGNPNNMNQLFQKFNHDMFILKHWGNFFPSECE